MKNIHSICKRILKLTDGEIDAAEEEARGQVGHVHPLKMATAGRINAAGNHNLRVLSALRQLRKEIATP